ncbi:MAG: glycoside hydrolase family 3 C-terminal domain-containing protein [Sedimentisphaerales bacterium]|nr:glycoside hydrolase family 3 C-terminal domain-containing protein [Sedimentisphaerales bacterium]
MRMPLFARGLLSSLLLLSPTISAASQTKPFSAYDAEAKELLAQMTLEEKVGQMIQPDFASMRDKTDIQRYYLGSVLMGGGSDPQAGNNLQAWTDVYDHAQGMALKTRLGIPLLFGVDAVHGHSNVLGAVIFPHNIGLGCTNNPDLVEKIARITALETRATGIQWTFAPCVTVVRDERWGRTYEGFSEEPKIASVLGAAAVRGLQGSDLSDPLSIAACAKHYIADGGTVPISSMGRRGGQAGDNRNFGGTARATRSGVRIRLNAGDVPIDEETLRRIHLPPYIDAVNAGVATIMPSYSSWNGVKCTASKRLLTEILKEELGFQGFLISDYSAISMIDRSDYKGSIATAINAGIDMGMVPNRYAEFFNNLQQLVEEGTVPMSRIDDAVTRILRVKCVMGLLDKGRSQLADRSRWSKFGSDEHRAVARDAVRQSLVLLKNENKTLPLAKSAARIHVGGKSADDIGNQCGGWTVEWQGRSGDVTTGGTTILAAIKNTVSANTEVTFAADGTGGAGATVGVVIVGERPYAEGNGDDGDLELDEADVAAIDNMKAAGIPVVVILISGRPMVVTDAIEKADAFIAAWLPGTEGQGVADVLFGDYKPSGKLSFSWPRSVDQLPINVGDENYDPLFAFGYGLRY